ncbi:hypothetical protein CHLNCDRAFT_138321 [Chlorella variabilis]|uniref:Uncharacterized protein n=1 Tax=Chlorella variabilis TaxID=554065 RepID=E1ZMS6_CHLVA|nr:hypothetical protein CHLNCDRAFT_138321 [Chlorella variabilis]EFN52744.1 hypothetical protein CHLNCDRAFT_138321 [Chlorella variabilis]|eukprot:XP_005844846.1 hypothetical protein CHLNCDRAFT_138321 [Chlorella variabilis]
MGMPHELPDQLPGSAFEQLGTLQWGDLGGEWARDSDLWQYSNSKLYCLMSAREMAKRLKGSGVDVLATQPGLVSTPLYDRTAPEKVTSWLFTAAARVMGQSPSRGAYSLVYAAGAPELDGRGGSYIGPPYLGMRLYEETAHLLEEKTGERPLPNKLPAAEHPWQEKAAGRDRAHPVDATLEARPPPYRHSLRSLVAVAMQGPGD